MADLEKTVSIIFSGVDKTSGVMTGIGRNLDQFSGQVANAAKPLADLAGGVLKTEAALAALAAGGLAYAYAKSIEFEGAAVELKRVLDDSATGFDEAKTSAVDLSNKFGISASSILSSTADFKQAGYNIEEAMTLTEASLKLATASELETSEASKILIATLKGFDAPVSDVNRLMDVFNYTSSISATSVGELSTGMSVLSPLASQMGYSFEEMAGLLTPIIEVFGSGSEAANALKIGLLNLGTSTTPVTTALEELKISQVDSNGEMKSAKEIMTEVQNKFTSLTDVQKTHVTQLLAGKNQASRMAIAFDGLSKSSAIVEANLKSNANSINNEVNIALQSGEKAVDRFGAGFQNLAISVGDNFRDATTAAINGATDIENTLQKLAAGGAFNELFSVFENMSAETAELFKGIATAMPGALENIDWSGFTGSIQNLGDSIGDLFKAFFDDADLTTAEGLADAIQKIIEAGEFLTNVTSGIIQVFEPFMGLLGDAVEYFTNAGKSSQEFIGKLMGWGVVLTAAAAGIGIVALELKAFSAIITILTGLNGAKTISSFGAAATGAIPALKTLSGVLTTAVGTGGLGASAGFLGLAAAAGYATGSILNEHAPAITTVSQKLLGWVDSIVNFTGTQKSASKAIQENDAFLSAQNMALERSMNAVNDLEDSISDADLKLEIDRTNLDEFLNDLDWVDFDIPPIPLPVETDYDAIQSDWDAITDELEKSDIRMPVKVDDKSIEDTKKKIKQSFSKSSMGAIELGVDVGGENGVGGIGDSIKDSIAEMEPIDIGEVVDLSGLSDLMDSIAGLENYGDRREMASEALKIAKSQRELMQAEARNLNTRNAILQQETQNITRMESSFDNTIKIEASGLEPEMEAFMWKLLKKIQVRANASGAEFLLAAT